MAEHEGIACELAAEEDRFLAALYAMRLANAVSLAPQSKGVIARRLDVMIRRVS